MPFLYQRLGMRRGTRLHGGGAGGTPLVVHPLPGITNTFAITPSITVGGAAQSVTPLPGVTTTIAKTPAVAVGGGGGVLVQSTQVYPGTSKAFSSANTVGNTLVALVSWNDPSLGTTASISDSLGNTWVPQTVRYSNAGGVKTAARLFVVNGCLGGANTITLSGTGTAGSNDYGMVIMEFSGLKTSSPTILQVFQAYFAGSTTTFTTNITPTVKSTLIALYADENATQGTISAGAGYTMAQKDQGHAHAVEYKVGVAAGATSASFTATGGSGDWLMLILAIEEL